MTQYIIQLWDTANTLRFTERGHSTQSAARASAEQWISHKPEWHYTITTHNNTTTQPDPEGA